MREQIRGNGETFEGFRGPGGPGGPGGRPPHGRPPEPIESEVKNKPSLAIERCERIHIIPGNPAKARKVNIEVVQEPFCDIVFEHEVLECKFLVKNHSNLEIEDVIFIDELVRGLKYIHDSFRINGRRRHAEVEGNKIKHRIRKLEPHEQLIITFDVKVL
ncbi:MAG: hypothetical protein FWB72_05970 [Firmicutes bacterium]|nr:hypothetical protein [Bacillota bacterium]